MGNRRAVLLILPIVPHQFARSVLSQEEGGGFGYVTATATPTPTPTPTPAAPTVTATPTPTPTVRMGFRISGCVSEFPRYPCGQLDATVRLNPLGLMSRGYGCQLAPGGFCFENIPPGTHTLTVSIALGSCNPWGCWPETPVTVVDQDVFVNIRT